MSGGDGNIETHEENYKTLSRNDRSLLRSPIKHTRAAILYYVVVMAIPTVGTSCYSYLHRIVLYLGCGCCIGHGNQQLPEH